MKTFAPTAFLCATLFAGSRAAPPTWPSSIDELEDVMYLGSGYGSRGFPSFVTPCSFSAHGPGRQTAAEWLRAGFHDMSTADIYHAAKGTAHGGLDASLALELNSGENIGDGFVSTFATYADYFNSRLSIADLLALGVHASVRACGGPLIPMRGGRVDATEAGPIGVPQPENGIGQFKNQFARMGFDTAEMITMTACGHTLGGVHANNFDSIVKPGTAPDDFQLFDNTNEFDNRIATQYINGPDSNPLVTGISKSTKRNSDFQMFNADGNVTLEAMTDPQTYDNMCASIFQRMIETVPPTVALSDIIEPYEVKPSGLQLTLLPGGKRLAFSGEIRVRTTVRGAIDSVKLQYKDRDGTTVQAPIKTVSVGAAKGFDDTFSFYSFEVDLPVKTSISSFNVLIAGSNGATQTYNNNGKGFPISDEVIVQTPQSCMDNGKLNVVAAVRSSVTTPVKMTVTEKLPRKAGNPIPSPVPSLVSASVTMEQGDSVGPYKLYHANRAVSSGKGTKYGVASGTFSDTFKDAADLGNNCEALGNGGPKQ